MNEAEKITHHRGSGPRQILAQGKHLRLIACDGWEYAERTTPNSVAVAMIAITDDQRVVLTEQYRIPMNKNVIELPAGLVGDIPGDAEEAASVAAQRELVEETGYEAGRLEHISTGPTSAGMANETICLYLVTGLRKVGPGGGDAGEAIHVHEIPLNELRTWLDGQLAQGKLVDPKVYLALCFGSNR
jgi:ADP-ribose pyrophosphatase